jgi:hypothetical protein
MPSVTHSIHASDGLPSFATQHCLFSWLACSIADCSTAVQLGLARTICIRCVYGIFGREITKYTVIYCVYIRFWPTLGTTQQQPSSVVLTAYLFWPAYSVTVLCIFSWSSQRCITKHRKALGVCPQHATFASLHTTYVGCSGDLHPSSASSGCP